MEASTRLRLDNVREACASCGKQAGAAEGGAKLLVCSVCSAVRYCSRVGSSSGHSRSA
jgi:hypothetical protein